MQDDLTTTLTKDGRLSFPASLRKSAGMKAGQKFQWLMDSETEFRLRLIEDPVDKLGPFKAIGYVRRKYRPNDTRTTDEIMAELREGEQDD